MLVPFFEIQIFTDQYRYEIHEMRAQIVPWFLLWRDMYNVRFLPDLMN